MVLKCMHEFEKNVIPKHKCLTYLSLVECKKKFANFFLISTYTLENVSCIDII